MKIFIVSACQVGLDDEYSVDKVFSTKKLADKYVEKGRNTARRHEVLELYNKFRDQWFIDNSDKYYGEQKEYSFEIECEMEQEFGEAILIYLIAKGYGDIAEDIINHPWVIETSYTIREYEVYSELND